MPPLPDVPGVLKVRWLHTLPDGSPAQVVWHLTYTGGPPSDADCVTLATLFYDSYSGAAGPVITGDTIMAGVDVTDLTTATSGAGTHVGTTAGSYTGVATPAQAAVLCSMPIARRYRGGKPRSYWPWLGVNALTSEGQWSTTAIAECQTAVTTLQSEIVGQSAGTTVIAGHVSVSYYEGFTSVLNPVTGRTRDVPKVRTGAIPVDPILSLACQTNPATQRRRLGRKR